MVAAGKERLVCGNPAGGLHASLVNNKTGSYLPRAHGPGSALKERHV